MNNQVFRYVAAGLLTLVMVTPAAAEIASPRCSSDAECNDDNACSTDSCFVSEGMCGDVTGSGSLTASDALHVLRFCTGLVNNCRPAVCDVDSDGAVSATDALHVLAEAVGLASNIHCTGECMHEAVVCDDLDACNGVETCDPGVGCMDGSALDCDDGNACTIDSCAAEGGCLNESIVCDDGDACNGVETCNPEMGCEQGEPLACGDGDICNGVESCDSELGCLMGQSLDCDDGSVCTLDKCDALEGCTYDTLNCEDGDACTTDTCIEDEGCTHGVVECSDGDVCNGQESCDSELGCLAGESLYCDDAMYCNGAEQCDAELGCVGGTAPDCSDDDECTDDACDEEADACVHDGMPAGTVDTISFEGLPEGSIVSEIYGDGGAGPIGVYGDNIEILPGMNAALIYDSSCAGGSCSGGDDDLGTPNETFAGPGIGVGGEAGALFENAAAQGNVLIVAHDLIDVDPADGLVDRASDQGNQRPVAMHFDFSAIGPVELNALTLLDVEQTEDPAVIELYGSEGELLASVLLPQTGNNGSAVLEFEPIAGVWSMIVSLFGSGAIDDIVLTKGVCGEQTTTTTTTTMPVTTTTMYDSSITTSMPYYSAMTMGIYESPAS
jgi:hypothetical protein